MSKIAVGQNVTIALFSHAPEGGRRLRDTFYAKATEVGTTHFKAVPLEVDAPHFSRDWFPIKNAHLVTVIPHITGR